MVSLLRKVRASAREFMRNRVGPQSLKEVNTLYVDIMKSRMSHDEAMEYAIGGDFGSRRPPPWSSRRPRRG
jgi:hypothetical protein